MATPAKIASALKRVRAIADDNQGHIVSSAQINRLDRELLVHAHWLQEITKIPKGSN